MEFHEFLMEFIRKFMGFIWLLIDLCGYRGGFRLARSSATELFSGSSSAEAQSVSASSRAMVGASDTPRSAT